MPEVSAGCRRPAPQASGSAARYPTLRTVSIKDSCSGPSFYGGTRTVDVHVRRLRAKLGPEHESMIATVRGVGYKLLPADQARAEREAERQAGQ